MLFCYLINFAIVKQVLHDQHVLPHGCARLGVLVTDSVNTQDLRQQSGPLFRKQCKDNPQFPTRLAYNGEFDVTED